ncbi:MAG: ribosome recycling factor [Chloroflexi bacterium]|nr:ribosome recycling factor [Chloroflexota bacterium]
MVNELLVNLNSDMQKCVDGLSHELATVRSGRASPALVEGILVEYHGASLPLKQVANISIPEPTLISIQPWDRSSLRSIEKAILKSNIGLNPSNDGNLIRLALPPLTEERRLQLAKLVGRQVEERKVALRNIRRDCVSKLRHMEKNKDISQNDLESTLRKVDDVSDVFVHRATEVGLAKEREIKEI